MANTRVQLLIETYEMAYGLVRYYTGSLKEVDPMKKWEVNDQQLNSVAWINAHLVWSEDFLLLKGLGGESTGIEWLDNFRIGSDAAAVVDIPDMKTILDARKTVHAATVKYLNTLTDDDLSKQNILGAGFGKEPTYLTLLQHAIRHEGTHAGHLGWLCKINNVKTV